MRAIGILGAIVGLAVAPVASAQADLERALRNYEALLHGHKRLGDLSPLEHQHVIELERALRARKLDKRSSAERCVDGEVRRLDGGLTFLAERSIAARCGTTSEGVRARAAR